jgi:hypothetical protein
MKKTSLLVQIISALIIFPILYWKNMLSVSNFRFSIIGYIIIFLIIQSERLAHKRRLLDWKNIRIQGKTRFILYDYVLIRGGIISIVFILILSLKVIISLLLLCTVLPLCGVMAFAGNEEWKQCEEQYTISTLKSVADKFKVLRN